MDERPALRCPQGERACAGAMGMLPAREAAAIADHLAGCPECREAIDRLKSALACLAYDRSDVLEPPAALRERLALRVAGPDAAGAPAADWQEPAWEDVAPGIECKLLARDADRARVSMLVRLAPDASYPPHTHAGIEHLYLLHGELWIEDRMLRPGDYSLGLPGVTDKRVWSGTGCTCVLITSTRDVLHRHE